MALAYLTVCLACFEADPCPIAEQLDEELGRCVPAFAESCPPGTMSRLGERDCVGVGPSECPEGFEAAEDGWGCAAVGPDAECDGVYMARLGRDRCDRIGPCDGRFPPAEATHLVTSDPFFDGQPRVYSSVYEAIEDAPEGSVIAVDRGIWYMPLAIDNSVSLVGRCAAQTVISARYHPELLHPVDLGRSAGNVEPHHALGSVVWSHGHRREQSDAK